MDNPFVLVFCAGIYPAVFLMSNNWFIYPMQDLFFLLLFTAIGVLAFAAMGYALVSMIRLSISFFISTLQKNAIKIAIRNTFFTLYTCFVLSFLLQSINVSLIRNPIIMWTVICAITICLVILAIKNGIRLFNSFVSILLVLAIFKFAYSFFSYSDIFHDDVWYTKNKDQNNKIVLKQRPNIYLICLESYHNKATLKEIYNYDNHDIEDKLKQNGFILYDNFYANYRNTLTSIVSLFTMEHHYYKISAGNNDALNARHIIGGKAYCPVVSIFQNNGYKTQYISYSDYCYLTGNLIDYVHPKRTVLNAFQLYQNNILDNWLSFFLPSYGDMAKLKGRVYVKQKTTHNLMVTRIRHASQSDTPYFTFIKLSKPDHFSGSWEKIDPLNGDYTGRVQKANSLITRLVDEILSNDSKSIIILFGDHGAYRYRYAWEGKRNIHENFANRKISEKSVAKDIFGVFLAIRYPNKRHDTKYEIKSPVNLMRYIFCYLCESDFPLKTKVADESYFNYKKKIFISVRDGRPLKHWETLNNSEVGEVSKSLTH